MCKHQTLINFFACVFVCLTLSACNDTDADYNDITHYKILDISDLTIKIGTESFYTTPELHAYPSPSLTSPCNNGKVEYFSTAIPLCISKFPLDEYNHGWLQEKGVIKIHFKPFDFNKLKIGDYLDYYANTGENYLFIYDEINHIESGEMYYFSGGSFIIEEIGLGWCDFFFNQPIGDGWYSTLIKDAPMLKVRFENGHFGRIINGKADELEASGHFALAIQYPDYPEPQK